MKAKDLKEKTIEELEKSLEELKKNLFSLKFQKASGQLDNPMTIANLKKDVARINTVIREKEIQAESEQKSKEQ